LPPQVQSPSALLALIPFAIPSDAICYSITTAISNHLLYRTVPLPVYPFLLSSCLLGVYNHKRRHTACTRRLILHHPYCRRGISHYCFLFLAHVCFCMTFMCTLSQFIPFPYLCSSALFSPSLYFSSVSSTPLVLVAGLLG